MIKSWIIWCCVLASLLLASPVYAQGSAGGGNNLQFDFCGNQVILPFNASLRISYNETPSAESVQKFYNAINAGKYKPTIDALLAFKKEHNLNDWLYYQLIRKTAEQVSPKAANYPRYTLYKWFMLGKSGYDAQLAVCKNQLVFYVYSDDNIYDIPYYVHDGRQYVCLNKHDYAGLNLLEEQIFPTGIAIPEGKTAFSYKVTQMPDFTPADYHEKDIDFNYKNKQYHFKLMVNTQVQNIFINYPVVDYESYFNIPLSKETYSSLIPALKENVKHMKQEEGVDYLMRFTRNSFLYEDDRQNFGKEKRMSPEQTLLYQYSDCDDRAALFFYLVKEVYNLPMIVMLYPTHVTIAVSFDKPLGGTVIEYKGRQYSVCEPTPQSRDLRIGQLPSEFKHASFQIAYEYIPR